MKRDMDLCREILLRIEAQPDTSRGVRIEVDDRTDQEIAYHLHLLVQAGLVEAIGVSDLDGLAYKAQRLTWWGHEFLDAARSDTVWRRAKDRVVGAAGGLAFDVLRAALLAEIRNRTGMDI